MNIGQCISAIIYLKDVDKAVYSLYEDRTGNA